MPYHRREGVADVLLAVAALALSALGGPSRTVASELRPNVLLITVDTLRADHLGAYGYERPTSPHLDAFASGAVLYRNAFASSPWTLPTHASLFTGKPPLAHGAHSFEVPERRNNARPLRSEEWTLAEALRADGYRTGAMVSNGGFLAKFWKLDQGFDTYEVHRGMRSDRLNEEVFAWLGVDDERPFFLFVNYMDTHRPYNTRPREGLLAEPVRQDAELLDELVGAVLGEHHPPPAELVRAVIDQYDTAIANVDEQIGALLTWLEQHGLDEDTVVVVTSDHGEYFGEHDLVEHSKDVYQPALWVPLIIRGPALLAGPEDASVEEGVVLSQGVAERILAWFPEADRLRHLASLGAASGAAPALAENYFTRPKDLFHPQWGARFQRVRRVLFDWPYKYIHSSDGAHELYDLAADPRESSNLLEARPDVASRLRAQLELVVELHSAEPEGELPVLSEEQKKQLRALGYVTGR